MRIKTQYILTMILFGLVLAAISASVALTNYRVEKVGEQERITHGIVQGASELSYLANDYMIYQESQQLDRWQGRFARFSAEVAGLHAERREQQALIRNIQDNTQRLAGVFDSVVSAIRTSQDQTPADVLAMLQVSWSRMAVQTQGLVADASRLAQLFGDQVDELQRTEVVIVIVLIAVFVAYFFMTYWMIQRRMLQSISTLQAGTAVIGSGNLDYRVEEKSNDEIGDLSHAFNHMAAALHELNETLEQRVATRTAEVRENEEKLRALFDAMADGVIVYDAAGVPVRANPAAMALLGADPVSSNWAERVSDLALRHPDGRPVAVPELASSRALQGERVVAQPLIHSHGNGQVLYLLASGTPLLDGDQVTGAVVVWHDITQRQQLEEAVRVQAKERAVLEERQRMARDLHDVVSQTLFSASLTADVLPKLYARDPGHGQKLLDELRRMNRGALAELRALLVELRPQALLDTDLAVLLRQLAEAAAGRSQVVIEVDTEQVGPLPATVQVALYRIAQEALHNVAKHSVASHATVRLGSGPEPGGRVELSIEDNGRGFDLESLPANTFGLSIMRERAHAIGARLSIESRPGCTRVRAEWAARDPAQGS